MSVITVANLKGGVGKTSLVINTAHALSKRFCETLVIDLDTQGDASHLLAATKKGVEGEGRSGHTSPGVRPANPNQNLLERFSSLCKDRIVEVRPSLHVLPVEAIQTLIPNGSIVTLAEHGDILPQLIKNLSYDYDNVVIDTPPTWSAIHEVGLQSSDLVLIPVDPSEMSVRAAITFLNSASSVSNVAALLVRTLVSRQASGIARHSQKKLEHEFLAESGGDESEMAPPKRVRLRGVLGQPNESPQIYLSRAAIYRSEVVHKLTYEQKTVFENRTLSHLQDGYVQIAKEVEKVIALSQPEAEEPEDGSLNFAFA